MVQLCISFSFVVQVCTLYTQTNFFLSLNFHQSGEVLKSFVMQSFSASVLKIKILDNKAMI